MKVSFDFGDGGCDVHNLYSDFGWGKNHYSLHLLLIDFTYVVRWSIYLNLSMNCKLNIIWWQNYSADCLIPLKNHHHIIKYTLQYLLNLSMNCVIEYNFITELFSWLPNTIKNPPHIIKYIKSVNINCILNINCIT